MTTPARPEDAPKKREWRMGSLESYLALTGTPVRYIYRNEEETPETRIRVGGENCDEDAALIVEAVNAYDGLCAQLKEAVEALEAVMDDCASGEADDTTIYAPHAETLGKVHAILSRLRNLETIDKLPDPAPVTPSPPTDHFCDACGERCRGACFKPEPKP